MKRILVTGASGFIAGHCIEHIMINTDWEVVALCRMSTVGDMHRFFDNPRIKKYGDRIKVVYHDTKFGIPEHISERIGNVDYILHLAANSHVDRSITYPMEFVYDNVVGTGYLLEWARNSGKFDKINGKFINCGTDEVFGPVKDHLYLESDEHRPSNPYAATKAAQLDLGFAYWVTYKMPIISTHMVNIFGERQNSEKLIPKAMKRILKGEPMPIHCKIEGDKVSEIGERCWLHARNAADAYLFLLEHGVPGEKYNVTSDTVLDNETIVRKIAQIMGKDVKIEYQDFHSARPGHDRIYGLDDSKIKKLGWTQKVPFNESLKHMIEWSMAPENKEWLI